MRRMIQQVATIARSGVLVATLAMFPENIATAATTDNWTDGTSFWNTAGNWTTASSTHVVPAAGDTVNIGPFGDGTLRTVTYDYPGSVTLAQLNIGLTGAGAATATLSMSANNLTSNNLYIGASANSRGTFDQTGGTNTIAAGSGFIDVGVFSGTTGTYNLSGTGSLVANTPEYLGDIGTGVFNQSGGTHTINGAGNNLYLGYNAGGGNGTYTLSAGALTVTNGEEHIGHSGTGIFNQTGGTNTIVSPHALFVGDNGGSNGTYTLSGGNLSVGGDENIGDISSGTFNQSGGANTASFIYVGHLIGPGVYNQSGGTTVCNGLYIASLFPSSTGSYTLSGGTLSVNAALVGTGNLAGSSALLTVSGTGVLTVGGTLQVANTSNNSLNLSGGTINTAALSLGVGGSPAKIHWTTGKLNLTQSVTWDSAASSDSTSAAFGPALALGSNQTLTVTGNETLGGTGVYSLTLNSGSTHNVTGDLSVNPTGTLSIGSGSTLTFSTFTQAGGIVNGTLQNQTTYTYQSGLFNGRLVNQGTLVYGSSFTAGSGIENHAPLTVAAGQTLTTNGAGLDNRAIFTIAAGGTLVATSAASQAEFIVNGSVTAMTFSNSGLLHGIGQVTAAVTNTASGDVRVVAGERLRFAGASFTNQGLAEAIGNGTSPAEIEFNTPVTNASSTGLITGRDNVLRFNGGLTNQGSLAISIGTSDVFGDINNSALGKIVVSGGAGATFYDDIVQNGTFRVSKVGSTTSVAVVFGAFSGSGGSTGGGDIFFEGDLRPGNSPATVTYDNNVGLGSGASLEIELGGTAPGIQFDQVHVSGQLALGGTLKINLIDLGTGQFAPHPGDSFDILNWGTLTGTFDSLQLPTLPGSLAWNSSQLYTAGVLSVVSGIPGDYNNNGTVDATDYVLWRKYQGTTHVLPNDPTGGTVGAAQYTTWRSHFGLLPGSGSGTAVSAAVPEPTTLVLLMFAAAAVCLLRRRAA